jgi:hypothetical protein
MTITMNPSLCRNLVVRLIASFYLLLAWRGAACIAEQQPLHADNQAAGVGAEQPKTPAAAKAASNKQPAATTLSADDFGVTTLTPPVLNVDLGPKYWPRMRMWQGIPSIERTAKGRLWATWYAGPLSDGSGGNHAVLVASGNDGRTWSNPIAVYDPTPFFDGNTGDPNLWIDPQGRPLVVRVSLAENQRPRRHSLVVGLLRGASG